MGPELSRMDHVVAAVVDVVVVVVVGAVADVVAVADVDVVAVAYFVVDYSEIAWILGCPATLLEILLP